MLRDAGAGRVEMAHTVRPRAGRDPAEVLSGRDRGLRHHERRRAPGGSRRNPRGPRRRRAPFPARGRHGEPRKSSSVPLRVPELILFWLPDTCYRSVACFSPKWCTLPYRPLQTQHARLS